MIEIQIHPSDIRRKVRFLFLDRNLVVCSIIGATLLLMFVIASMAVAPSVIRHVYKSSYLNFMRDEQLVQRERLRQHVDQIQSLERLLDEQRIHIEKLSLVYGLDRSLVVGQGGASPGMIDRKSPAMNELKDAHRREIQLRKSISRLQQQIDVLTRFETENAQLVRNIPSILPLPADQFVLTSPFGGRINPFTRAGDFHKGLDLAAPTGTPVYSTADGVVTFAGRYPLSQSVNWWRFGNVVVLSHGDHFITIYAHCDSVSVKAGQRIHQGEAVATVGSSGWSTNSHLHYEVRSDLQRPGNFDPVDPRIYILNYQWNNEEKLLISARSSKDYRNFDPLPAAFIGRRRV